MATQNIDDSVLQFPILIGDIGGTNARFAILVDANAEPKQFPIVQTADFATIDDAIQSAILDRTSLQPRSAVLAVAGPVDGDEIELTNCPWVVRPRAMIENLGDAYEAIEEMYGMIWKLAVMLGTLGGDQTLSPADYVEMARQNYQAGLELSEQWAEGKRP